jgi:Cu-Zn family superoxide dismutase
MRQLLLAAAAPLILVAACGESGADDTEIETRSAAAPQTTDDGYGAASGDMDMDDQDMQDDDRMAGMQDRDGMGGMMDHEPTPLEAPAAGETARAEFIGTDGEPIGTAILSAGPLGMLFRVDLTGMEEGFHGIHLHMVGDCSDYENGFKASGSHINPTGAQHGLMNADGHELADMPNVYAHHSGHVRAELFAHRLTEDEAMDADGFAMVVHANPDDHQTQPIGGAGDRLACAAFTN